jgi:hypothetical protein
VSAGGREEEKEEEVSTNLKLRRIRVKSLSSIGDKSHDT